MCKSKAEGGQRCYSHAFDRAETAYQRFNDAYWDARAKARAGDPQGHDVRDEVERLRIAYAHALVDLASTPQGEAELRSGDYPVPSYAGGGLKFWAIEQAHARKAANATRR